LAALRTKTPIENVGQWCGGAAVLDNGVAVRDGGAGRRHFPVFVPKLPDDSRVASQRDISLPSFAERLAPFERARRPPLTGLRRRSAAGTAAFAVPVWVARRRTDIGDGHGHGHGSVPTGRLLRDGGIAARNVRRSGDSG
jgi:hypothetical protein